MVPAWELYGIFVATIIGLSGLYLSAGIANKPGVRMKVTKYPSGKFKRILYFDTETDELVSADVFDEEGKLIDTIRYR